jgi:two-component system, cell cycle sensor histidine kinase and response regulator CckA
MPNRDLQFVQLLDKAPLGVVVVDQDGRIAWANATYLAQRGNDPATTGSEVARIPEFVGTPIPGAVADGLRHGISTSLLSVPLHTDDRKETRYVDVQIQVASQSGSEAPRLLLLVNDVTERIHEHELARLFYESFLTSTNAIEVTDRNGILVDVNPAFERIYGYTRAECIGKKPNLVRSRKTSASLLAKMWADLLDPQRGHWTGEIANQDRKGREHQVLLTITAVRSEAGEITHYVGVAVDLTEQRVWERQIEHTDRLTSLGQLAAGVAHEINTPLANVMLIAESVRRRTTDPYVRARIDTITTQVEVAANIVRGLLDFARRSEPQVTSLDLGVVTHESIEFLRGKQSADVELTENYGPDPLPILGDRGQLIQVITNILNNAYEASGENGGNRIRVQGRRRENWAEIEIADAGPGIPANALPHIFEPFFTTKPEGKGTGLGLAICHEIIRAHNGNIQANNLPEGGASFVISLPLVPASV